MTDITNIFFNEAQLCWQKKLGHAKCQSKVFVHPNYHILSTSTRGRTSEVQEG